MEAHFPQVGGLSTGITVQVGEEKHIFKAAGNGRLDAISNALKANLGLEYELVTYKEHALQTGSNAQAIAYVAIRYGDGKISWGAGTHDDIMAASVNALVSAINRRQL